jgi:hypothetical protein
MSILYFLLLLLLVPLSAILLLTWLATRRAVFGKALGIMWLALAGPVLILHGWQKLVAKKEIDRNDIYGSYVIDRSKFPGRQADWQYNHYWFEIRHPDQFIFHVTDGKKILTTYKGKVHFLEVYANPRIELIVEPPGYHVIEPKPTLYRTRWGFYYVFHSTEFGNVFFTKGEWKPLKEF